VSVLITGGAGFIGSHLAETILKTTNDSVVILDDFNDYYAPDLKHHNISLLTPQSRLSVYKDTICNWDTVKRIFHTHSITSVFHLAARAGVRPSLTQPLLYEEVNVKGTLHLLEAARQYKCNRFIFASSSSVYGNNKKVPFSETDAVDHPISPYAATKKAGELHCFTYHHLYGLPIACVRFFTVYGPRQRPEMAIHQFTRHIDEGREIKVFNHGQCFRDYTYISDIIDGLMKIYEYPNLTYDIVNLGESNTISTLDMIGLIESALGKKAKVSLIDRVQGDVELTYADISHARNKYNYSPQFPIKEGIEKFVQWYLGYR
jgi:UDP-glucuronate 4-epimerase